MPGTTLLRLPVTSRPRRSAVLVAAIILVGLIAAACGEEDVPVSLTSASRITVAQMVDAAARVTARSAATLAAPAAGTLASLRVGPGDTVRAGQILAVIHSPGAQYQLKRARQTLDAANRAGSRAGRGELARTQRSTDRAAARAFEDACRSAGKLADRQLRAALLVQIQAAQRQYDLAARAAAEAVRELRRGVVRLDAAVGAIAAAQRLQAQQAYDLAKATVDALTLRAPIGGVVQYGGGGSPTAVAGPVASLSGVLGSPGGFGSPGVLGGLGSAGLVPGLDAAGGPASPATAAGADGAVVAVGAPVAAGTPILTVVDVTELGLVAGVDEADVLTVAPGTPATVELDAVSDASFQAKVRSVDVLPAAAPGGGVSYRVRLSLAAGSRPDGGPAPVPRPGMSAVVHLRVREAPDAVAVPAAAVFSVDGHDAVWVARAGRAHRVAVTVGVRGGDLVQVVDGVRPGDRVVVRNVHQVHSGQPLP